MIERLINKPLTVEELKALEVGDWVWIIYQKQYATESFYAQICSAMDGKYIKHDVAGVFTHFEDYGIKWIAYKNKEQAEDNNLKNIQTIVRAVLRKLKKMLPNCIDGDNEEAVLSQTEAIMEVENEIDELYEEMYDEKLETDEEIEKELGYKKAKGVDWI